MNKIYLVTAAIFFALCTSSCQSGHSAAAPVAEPVSGISPADSTLIQKAESQIEKSPNDPAGYEKLAGLYIKAARSSGNFSLNYKAEETIKKALAIAPDHKMSRMLYLSLQATFHRFPDAVALGNQLAKDYPQDSFTYGILTDANVELGNYDDAVAAAQKMVDLKPNSSSYARVGHIRSLHGDHQGAIQMFELAAKTADPMDKEANSWCYVFLGKEYLKYGELDAAEQAIDTSLSTSPNYLLARVEKARILAIRGDLKGASDQISDEAAQFISPQAYMLRGDIALKQGNKALADEEYQKAEVAAHNLEGDMHPFALLWADHDVRLDEALAIAEKDFAINKDIYAADIYAWCLYKKGRFADADAAIAKAMRLNTADARILYHAGMIKKALGDKTAGNALLASALKTDPTFDLLQADRARAELSNAG